MAKNVGVYFTFRVAPENDAKVEEVMTEIFEAMKKEEYPSGDVITYTLFRDPTEVGKWAMFELFTQKGSDNHSPPNTQVFDIGRDRLVPMMLEPYTRVLLNPVIVHGCGEPLPKN